MVLCENCRENVLPSMHFNWRGFIRGLGIPYLIYFMTKIPQCPNCNFPMPRRNMVFAVQLPQNLIKLARIGALQLTHLKDSLTSVSRRFSQNHKFDPSQHLASANMHKTASFNKMVNEVHNTISLKSYESNRQYRFR
jgi:hypothetical protein